MIQDIFTSFQKKSDEIIVEATKFETDMNNKIDDHHTSLDARIDHLQITDIAEL